MIQANAVSDVALMRVAGSVQQTFRPRNNAVDPFGATPPVSHDAFIERLVRHAEQKDFSYDPELAYVLSVIAGWSYSDGQTLANKLKYYGFALNTVDTIQVLNPAMSIIATAYFVRSECGRVGVLSFRGTEPTNAMNWLTDADVTLRAIAGGKVHSGFYANLQALWDDICAHLTHATKRGGSRGPGNPPQGGNGGDSRSASAEAEPSPRQKMQILYITGHSLGAAMAALAAARLFTDDGPITRDALGGVYTFGQPAVGDAAFASYCEDTFGKKLFRHVYAYDVVPHLPPRSTGNFVHFGSERVTFSVNEAWASPTKAYARQAHLILSAIAASGASFAARRLRWFAKLKFQYSMDDHSPTRYIEASHAAVGR